MIDNKLAFLLVRLKGLEPSRRKTLDPKSSASANSATSAIQKSGAKLRKKTEPANFCRIIVVFHCFGVARGSENLGAACLYIFYNKEESPTAINGNKMVRKYFPIRKSHCFSFFYSFSYHFCPSGHFPYHRWWAQDFCRRASELFW